MKLVSFVFLSFLSSKVKMKLHYGVVIYLLNFVWFFNHYFQT
jgi:hypothetical protein